MPSLSNILRVIAVLAVLLAALATAPDGVEPRAASPDRLEATTVVRIIDGDTFAIASGEKVRVRNFDTPELSRPRCAEEKERAIRSRKAAADILDGRRVTLVVFNRDRYGRLIADVSVRRGAMRVDFAALMTARGDGELWAYGREPKPSWCGEAVASAE